jgi:hypothetical protein
MPAFFTFAFYLLPFYLLSSRPFVAGVALGVAKEARVEPVHAAVQLLQLGQDLLVKAHMYTSGSTNSRPTFYHRFRQGVMSCLPRQHPGRA